MVAKRIANIDSLAQNKEKKMFFEQIEGYEEYYPFGTPGNHAF